MFRRFARHKAQHTYPDHRPMIPELRNPRDPIDAAVREVLRRYDDINPDKYQKWR